MQSWLTAWSINNDLYYVNHVNIKKKWLKHDLNKEQTKSTRQTVNQQTLKCIMDIEQKSNKILPG